MSLPALFALSSVKEVNGYSHQTSLPTTIDLNASTESEIRSYYKNLRNLTPSQTQGEELLKRLKTILKTDQKYLSYDSGSGVWQLYEISDRDWDLSPASSTKYGTYNSSTNKITNYQYGTSASNSKNNPYIHALYINRDVENKTTAWDDHQQTEWGINREHVWAKAEGFDSSDNSDSTTGGARGDPMHLMAGNGYSNNIHSNYFFGYVDKSKIDTDCGDKYSNQKGNLRGTSSTLNGSTKVFEPQDSDKGDIARAIFYMVARYNYLSGSDSDGINANNPNLSLSQSLSDWSNTGYTSSTTRKGYMGIMTDLLNWHHSDPVDDYEIRRNNILYKNYTNNRNPFIDFPEWVDYIWGTATYNGTTYVSYNSNPTGSADPDSDTINGYNSGSAIAVTGVTLSPSTSEVEVNKSVTLTASVSPSNATDKSVTWTSSDTSIATVSSGVVSGVSEGNVTITVTTNDGGFSASSTITVIPESVDPTPTGDISFSRSGSTDTVTSGYELVKTSTKAQLEYYQDKSSSEGLDLGIKKSSGNIWTTSPNKIALKVKVGGGSTRNPLTNNLIAHFIDSNGDIISSSETIVTNKVETTTGQEYTVLMPATNNVAGVMLHHTKEESYNIRVYSITLSIIKELESITLDTDNVQKEFLTTDTFNYDDLGVTANYSDETSAVVIPTNVSTPDLSTVGTKTVTVSYTEGDVTKEATYEITVSAPTVTLSSISVSNPTTSFDVGDEFVFGGTVTAHYSDSSTKDVTSTSNFIGYDAYTSGTQTITVSYSENGVSVDTTYTISVNEIEGSTTVRTSIGTYASAHNWVNGTSYGSVELDGVITATKVGTGNNGRYYTSGQDWRFYQNGSGAITISAADNYLIDKITITFTDSNTGILIDENDEPLSPGIAEDINANSAAFTVSNSGSATNGIIKITEFIVIYHYVAPAPMTSISASVSKDYHPGDVITKSDITVTGDNGEIVTGFSFANDNYQFTYQDAPSGGQVLARTFTNSISYLTFTCSLTVNVSRNNYAQRTTSTYSLTTTDFANHVSTTTGTHTLPKNDVDFVATNSYLYSSNYLTLYTYKSGTAYKTDGVIYNDQALSGEIVSVTYELYGNNKPTIDPTITYGTSKNPTSTINDGHATFFEISYKGTFTGYVNFKSITVTVKKAETALNVANYIMYEDTNNQCETKFDIAANYFNDMSISERNTFMTSNDYVILNARERFNAWARHLGKQVSFENNDYVIKEAIQIVPLINKVSSNNMIAVVTISSLLGLSAIVGYFYIRKKKED